MGRKTCIRISLLTVILAWACLSTSQDKRFVERFKNICLQWFSADVLVKVNDIFRLKPIVVKESAEQVKLKVHRISSPIVEPCPGPRKNLHVNYIQHFPEGTLWDYKALVGNIDTEGFFWSARAAQFHA